MCFFDVLPYSETYRPDNQDVMNTEQENRVTSQPRQEDTAWLRHVVPFIAWLFLMQMMGDPAGWKYAVRSVVCLGLFWGMRPWRGYAAINWRQAPIALLVGIVVFIVWVAPESVWVAERFPRFRDFYLRWGVMPFGRLREVSNARPYAPEVAGWAWAFARLAGSAAVISAIEEFFWRGFLYRWMFDRDFMRVNLGVWHAGYFLLVNLVFGLEHESWFTGWIAGLAYGWVMLRTRNIWTAVLAHGVTNYLLGWYVLATGQYHYW